MFYTVLLNYLVGFKSIILLGAVLAATIPRSLLRLIRFMQCLSIESILLALPVMNSCYTLTEDKVYCIRKNSEFPQWDTVSVTERATLKNPRVNKA